MVFFPQDTMGSKMTVKGKVHMVLVALVSPLTVVSMLLVALHFSIPPSGSIGWKANSAIFTYVSLGLVFLAGLLAAINVAKHAKFDGLFGRMAIGSFLQLIFALAVVALTRDWLCPS
jgi:hypothetical protein